MTGAAPGASRRRTIGSTVQPFSLAPFPEEGVPAIRIAGTVRRLSGILAIRCALRGELERVAVPAPTRVRARKDLLWQETCVEFFLGAAGEEEYREFNMSPAGHWNAYRFASYRAGMREETAVARLPFRVRRAPGALRLALDLDIGALIPAGIAVEVGVAAVVRAVDGTTSHWALAHPGPRPDFHRREGFALRLPVFDAAAISGGTRRSAPGG